MHVGGLSDGGDGAVDQFRVDERANSIMDQNLARRVVFQRKQPEPDGLLPGRTANDGGDSLDLAARRLPEQLVVVGVDGDDNLAGSRMGKKHLQRMRNDRTAADVLVLLRAVGLPGTSAAAGGDDHHGNPTCRARVFACVSHGDWLSARSPKV